MFDRHELKHKGHRAFLSNYWRCVLVAFILLLTGSGGSSGRSGNKNKENSIFKPGASFSDTYLAFVAFVLMFMLIIVIIALIVIIVCIILKTFLLNPLSVGCHKFLLNNAEYEDARLDALGCGFNNYSRNVKTMFLRDLFIFLWSCLLIIPGIIKAYEYRLIPYLLAENPELSSVEAFDLSRSMMDGRKWDTFVLDLSFIGWHILSSITFGLVGIFYTAPYLQATNAELYLTLKEANGIHF